MLDYRHNDLPSAPLSDSLISIVIPAYNEGQRIRSAVEAVLMVFLAARRQVEIIVVDDGSTDSTYTEAMFMAQEYPQNVCVIPLLENHGKGFAIRAGFLRSHGDVVGFIDADLEYPVDALPIMAALIQSEPTSCAIGTRVVDDRHSWEKFTSKTAHRIASIALQLPVDDTQAGLKMFPGNFTRTVLSECREDGWLYDIEALLHAAERRLNIVEIPVMQRSVRRRRANVWTMVACGPALMRMAWPRWRHPSHELRQVTRFGLVGIINSLVDFATYWFLLRLWSPHYNGIQAGFESLIAWLVASVAGYALHSRFTFHRRLPAGGFYVVTGLGVAIQVVTTGLMTQWLGSSHALWGKALGIGLASMVTYFGYRYIARQLHRTSSEISQSLVRRLNIPAVLSQDPTEVM